MEPWIIWLIAAALLLLTEVLTQMMWALCLTIGALAAMVCALCGMPIIGQLITLVVAGIAAYALLLPTFRRHWLKKSEHSSRTGMDALLGRRAVVTHEILPDRIGRARIDGDSWQVRAPGIRSTINVGSEVVVTAYDSIILSVELLHSSSES